MDRLKTIARNDKILNLVINGRYYENHILVPDYINTDIKKLDLSACIEYTLHTMLDNNFSDADIYKYLGAEKIDKYTSDELQELENNGQLYYIDLDYIISDYLMSVFE